MGRETISDEMKSICGVCACRSSLDGLAEPSVAQGDLLDVSRHAGKPGWLLAASVTSPALGQVAHEVIDYGERH
jgi:hypothetical protein